jgi:asparagine synthase (glutamine-hydrolysing)
LTIIAGLLTNFGECYREDDIAAMMSSFGSEDRDGLYGWRDQTIYLAQVTDHNTTESLKEQLPLFNEQARLCITGDIRLDNRDELFAKLSVPNSQRLSMGDAELVLKAYSYWKNKCVEHLLGDYVFAIWDQEKRELFCCNDHFGNRSLFYYFDGRRFIFATAIQVIKAMPGLKTSLNYDRLAYFIDSSLSSISQEESWFKNIFQLLPATVLTVGVNGIKTKRYWQPTLGRELTFKTDEEYREAFQEVFFEAVSCRLRSEFPVTALLSGGLDSSSIVSVAAKILEKQNRVLHVFSAVLPDENDSVLKDERYYIDQFRSFPNVQIHYSTPQGKGFFSDMDKLHHMASPGMSSRYYLYRDFIKKAGELNSRVILDGVFGEASATNKGDGFYAELFGKWQWPLLWKELNARKQLVGDSISYQIRTQVIKPFVPNFLTDLYRNRDKVDININGYNFFQQEIAEDLKNRVILLKGDHYKSDFNIAPNQRANQLSLLLAKHNRVNSQINQGPTEFRYPFTDKRLLEFCLNAPATLKVRNGYKRSLIRVGLNGILPPEIQWRNTKCPFSPDYMRRYNAQVNQVRKFLDEIKNNDPVRTIIDIEKIKTYAMLPVADNETDTFKIQIAMHHLPKAIYTIHFLRQFKEFQQ